MKRLADRVTFSWMKRRTVWKRRRAAGRFFFVETLAGIIEIPAMTIFVFRSKIKSWTSNSPPPLLLAQFQNCRKLRVKQFFRKNASSKNEQNDPCGTSNNKTGVPKCQSFSKQWSTCCTVVLNYCPSWIQLNFLSGKKPLFTLWTLALKLVSQRRLRRAAADLVNDQT